MLASHACGLVALDKPPGVRAHPNVSGEVDPKAIVQAPYDLEREHFFDLGQGAEHDNVHLLNRIDAATSGVLLVALNFKVAQAVRELFVRQRVEKTYLAIVKGRPPGAPDVWIDALERVKNKQQGVSAHHGHHSSSRHAKMAKTRIQWMASDENRLGLSLMRLFPYTGRTHQLRVQCALRGCPILGDRKYGDFKFNQAIERMTNIKRLCLHAHEIRVDFAFNKQVIDFKVQSPVPESFDQLIQQNPSILRNVADQAIQPIEIKPTKRVREGAKKKQARRRYL